MYVIIPFELFDVLNIFFGKKQTNNMVSYCYFTSILYSTKHFSLSNVIFHIKLFPIRIKHMNDMMHIYFDNNTDHHRTCISNVSNIEKGILKAYSGVKDNVFIQENITNQFIKGALKLHIATSLKKTYSSFQNNHVDILLRVSGVWENEYSKIGLIYKFMLPSIQEQSIYTPQYYTHNNADMNHS